MDPRALQGLPQEVLDSINSGDIDQIFRTQPNLTPDDLKAFGLSEDAGSIYFRKTTGETARWKLPELSMGQDAGWNANRGMGAFSEQTIYVSEQNLGDLQRLPGAQKLAAQQPGVYSLSDELQGFISGNDPGSTNLGRIKAGERALIGAREIVDTPTQAPKPIQQQAVRVASNNAEKAIPLADEYDTGNTAAKVANNEPVSPPPPKSAVMVGTPVEGATTTPAPKGTTPAAQKIGTSGAPVAPPRQSVRVQTPQTQKITQGPTAGQPSRALVPMAKIESDAVQDQVLKTTTKRTSSDLLDIAKNVAKRNPREMGIAAAGLLLGVGVYSYNRQKGDRLR